MAQGDLYREALVRTHAKEVMHKTPDAIVERTDEYVENEFNLPSRLGCLRLGFGGIDKGVFSRQHAEHDTA